MIEDKLTHDERLKLECIAQAIAYRGGFGTSNAEAVLQDATTFEHHVQSGETTLFQMYGYFVPSEGRFRDESEADQSTDIKLYRRAETPTA